MWDIESFPIVPVNRPGQATKADQFSCLVTVTKRTLSKNGDAGSSMSRGVNRVHGDGRNDATRHVERPVMALSLVQKVLIKCSFPVPTLCTV